MEFGLATISVMASDRHTRIVYAFAIAKKPITAKITLCGKQNTAKKKEEKKTRQKNELIIIYSFIDKVVQVYEILLNCQSINVCQSQEAMNNK